MTSQEIKAESWAESVISGVRPACVWTKHAIERQRTDLLRQGAADFPFIWIPEDGETVIDFFSCLTHIKGEYAGKPFLLTPWQTWLILTLFSWKHQDNTRLRRYRRLLLECGKSSGKTAMSSGILLYLLAADGEGGAECVTAARATNQARLCFDFCRDTLRANPRLTDSLGLKVLQHSIVQPSSASTLLPVSAQGKSLAGKILHGAAVDELWSHRSREVYEEMSLGCDKRNNSLLISLGHAGENLLSVGYELHNTSTKILGGELKDEKTLSLIFSAEGYPWESDDAILAANPNAGVSSYLNTIQEARDRAVVIHNLRPTYKSHMLVLWEDGNEAKQWITRELVERCTDQTAMDQLRFWSVGEHDAINAPDQLRPFVVGMERSSLQERACVVYCCKSFLAGVEHFYLFPRYFEPAANDDEQLADAVLAENHGFITYGVTVGNPDGYKLKALAHDSWMTPSPRVAKARIDVLPFAKTARTFSPVMDFAMSLAIAGRIHFSDETLASHLLGIYAKRDLNNNLFPRRAHVDRTIDAAIASFYALRLAMVPSMLAPPANDGVVSTFIMEDGSVMQGDKDGHLMVVSPPDEIKTKGAHPSDRQ
jgi:phage terminase large subunit-like protein